MAKLTAKQERFVEAYLVDLNATQAAIRAGYSPETAKEIGYENLTKPHIRAKIDKAMAERSKRTGISADRVLNELAKIGFANAADIIDFESGEVLAYATKEDTACIQSVKIKNTRTDMGSTEEREIKLYDKHKALDSLARHLGLYNDKLSLEGDVGVKIIDDMEIDDDS